MIAQTTYPFALPPLPYAYDALEPYVDEATMHFHHDTHLKTYVITSTRHWRPILNITPGHWRHF